MRKIGVLVAVILLAGQVNGCTPYKSQFVSFRPPEAYVNKQDVAGVSIGAEAYADKDVALEAFGFDIRGAGLLPVQLVMNNQSGSSLQIVAEQTFLIDAQGNYWQVVPNNVALDRVEKSTQLASLGKGAGTGALWGAAGGAILGAAIGIVSGENVGSTMGKGAALGGAGGALVGTSQAASSPDRRIDIINDIRSKGIENKTVPKDYLANGFIFFPGEAKSAKILKLRYRELESGTVRNVTINL